MNSSPQKVIITAPSLNTMENISGVSSVVKFIIENNPSYDYLHFPMGKKDGEKGHPWKRGPKLFKAYRKWKKLLTSEKTAIIHYSYPLSTFSIIRDYVFMRYAYLHHGEMVVHIHGGLYLNKEKRPWLLNKILKEVFHWKVPFIVLSEGEKEKIQKLFGAQQVYVLPNCVELKEAIGVKKDFTKKKTLDILYMGRIEINKGIDYILAAFKELNKKEIQIKLHFAGKEEIKDSYLPQFQNLLKDSFIYEGIVSGKSKTELLRKCDIFLMPTFFEGLPMSLIECMSFGLIPIVTNVGSIDTVVKDGENGVFVPVKKHQEIVECIIHVDNDRKYAQQLSMAAQQQIFMLFSPKHYIEMLNKIDQELV